LALVLVAATSPCRAAEWNFEAGLAGFSAAGKGAEVALETAAPLSGRASLRIEVAPDRHDARVTSPAFHVEPWAIYRVALASRLDRGVDLRIAAQLTADGGWRDIGATWRGAATLLATLPDTAKAKLELIVRVPGQALGRSATVDDVAVERIAPVVREKGPNLYWDGSFERAPTLPPDGWAFWVRQPAKVEFSTREPRSGRHCLRIEGDNTYPVLPVVQVKPRHLYRLRYWVRGEGAIYPGLHKLAPKRADDIRLATAARVGWSGGRPSEVRLKPDAWQVVEVIAACEDASVLWFQPLFVLRGGYVEVDDLALQSLE
jgi:hypothetical protein